MALNFSDERIPFFFNRMIQFWTILLVGLLLFHIISLPHHINPDVALYHDVGHKLLDGERPYVDYEENNFPVIHLLNTPAALLARITGLPTTITFHVFVLALFFASLGLLRHLLSRLTDKPIILTVFLFGMIALSWVFVIIMQWGQREHLFTLFYMPWLVMRVLRRDEKTISWALAFTVGVMAGIGVAIKPYFAVVAVLVELVAIATSRKWLIRTPEVLSVGLVAGLHGLYFLLNPDVFQAFILLMQRLVAGYGAYIPATEEQRQGLLLTHSVISAIPFALLLLRYRYRVVPQALITSLAAMGIGGILAWLLQDKGWTYHAIPFMTSSVLIVTLLIAEGFLGYVRPSDYRRQNLVRLVCIALGIGFGAGFVIFAVLGRQGAIETAEKIHLFTFNHYLETYTQPQDRVMVIDTIPSPTYPMLSVLNRRNASRYAMGTPFPASYYHYEGSTYTDPAHVVPPYMQEYLDALVEDVAEYTPKLILIRSDQCGSCRGDYRYLYDYLVGRGVMDAVITPNYTLLNVEAGFHVYLRNDLAE